MYYKVYAFAEMCVRRIDLIWPMCISELESVGLRPRYLADIVQPTFARVTDGQLQAEDQVRRARAYSVSGPAAWKSVPVDLRSVPDRTDFQNKL